MPSEQLTIQFDDEPTQEPTVGDDSDAQTPEVRTHTEDERTRQIAVIVGRHALVEGERGDRAVPIDEEGMVILDEVRPGMFHPLWGPVKGTFFDATERSAPDFNRNPQAFTKGQQKYGAARRYLELENFRARAILEGRLERVDELDRSMHQHLRWADQQGLREPQN